MISDAPDDVVARFQRELGALLKRCLRLSRNRDIQIRANSVDLVLHTSVPVQRLDEFIKATPPCYVHVTNLGRSTDASRIRWAGLRFAIGRRLLNSALGLMCSVLPAAEAKNRLYRLMGMTIGKDVEICQGAFLDPFCPGLITIGEGTVVGSFAKVFAHIYRGQGRLFFGPVVIGRDCVITGTSTVGPCFIEDAVTVLPGATAMSLLRRVRSGAVVGIELQSEELQKTLSELPK